MGNPGLLSTPKRPIPSQTGRALIYKQEEQEMSDTAIPTAAPEFPAGWYDDPQRVGNKRWWTGTEWAPPHYDPSQVPDYVGPPPPETAGGLVVVGYITAVLMPLIGFILGIVVATRPSKVTSKHGAWIIVVSIVAFIIYLAIIAHSAQVTTATTY
jgi:hypothetical protein